MLPSTLREKGEKAVLFAVEEFPNQQKGPDEDAEKADMEFPAHLMAQQHEDAVDDRRDDPEDGPHPKKNAQIHLRRMGGWLADSRIVNRREFHVPHCTHEVANRTGLAMMLMGL